MLLMIAEEDQFTTVTNQDSVITATIFDRPLNIYYLNGSYIPRFPNEYQYITQVNDYGTQYYVSDIAGNTLTMDLYQDIKGYGHFQKIKLNQDILVIGSAIEDDIYLRQEGCVAHQIQIDVQHHTITCLKAALRVYINHHRVKSSYTYQIGEELQIGLLRVIMHDEFIMYNTCPNIYCNLDVLKNDTVVHTVKDIAVILYDKKFMQQIKFPRIDWKEPVVPEIHDNLNRSLIFAIGPTLTMAAGTLSIGILMTYQNIQQGRGLNQSISMLIFPIIMIISTLFWTPLQRRADRKQKEKQYKDRLVQAQIQKDEAIHTICEYLKMYNQGIEKKWSLFDQIYSDIKTNHQVECLDSSDIDFYQLYLGKLDTQCYLQMNDGISEELIQGVYERIPKLGELINLSECTLGIYDTSGNQDYCLFVLAQLLFLHDPQSLKIVIVTDTYDTAALFWKIPHVYHKDFGRLIYTRDSFKDICGILKTRLKSEFIVISDSYLEECINQNIRFICISEDSYDRCTVSIKVMNHHECIYINRLKQTQDKLTYEEVDRKSFEELIYHVAIGNIDCIQHRKYSFFAVNRIDRITSGDIKLNWQENSNSTHLITCIGMQSNGKSVQLDLHESGSGPHGLIAGMTGSGKSEFIISMILSLCISYSYQDLQIAIIDFKGGGCAQALNYHGTYIPHIVGVLSNLDISQSERALFSLRKVCEYREELLNKLSDICDDSISSIDQYRKYWNKEYNIPYLGHLLIVIDEFAELKKENPDFLTQLITIARIGRSLGIHLLLSTQKPAGVVNEQIWSNTSYKICLKVQDRQDSMEVLHDDCAVKLLTPGSFYILENQRLTEGISGYANTYVQDDAHMMHIKDAFGKNITKYNSTQTDITERSYLLSEIMKLNHVYEAADMLWQQPLRNITWDDIHDVNCFGMVDDFYHNCYSEISLKNTNVCMAMTRKQINSFYLSILYMLKRSKQECEIYYVCRSDSAWKSDFISGFICFSQVERIQYLANRIRNTDSQKYIFIEESGMFLNEDSIYQELFREWLNYAEQYHLTLIMGCQDSTEYRYKDFSKFQQKIVISAKSNQDVNVFFEHVISQLPNKGVGLIEYEDEILDFVVPEVTYESLIAYEDYRVHRYKLPIMPDVCCYVQDNNEEYIVGISYATFAYIHISKASLLVMVYADQHIFRTLSDLWRKQNIQIYNSFEESKDKSGILFMHIDTYEKSSRFINHSNQHVMYIGRGFLQQYCFKHVQNTDLRSDEAILFHDYDWEKIKLVTKINNECE